MPAVQRTVRLLWSAPKPLIAAYNGSATAGGLDFGLCCDVRVAAGSAPVRRELCQSRHGPGGRGCVSPPVPDRAPGGDEDARRRVRSSTPRRRFASGMVAEVCADDALIVRAHEVALEMTHGPSATFARAKRVARAAATVELEAALQASLAANIELDCPPRGPRADPRRHGAVRPGARSPCLRW